MVTTNHILILPLLLLLLSRYTNSLVCQQNQILCRSTSKCVNIGYICDGDNDCGDHSDESFCSEWGATGCSTRGEARCQITGRSDTCVSMSTYCTKNDPPCSGTVDPRICKILKDNKLQRLMDVVISPVTAALTATVTTTVTPITTIGNLEKSEDQGAILAEAMNVTIEHPDCPNLYTRVGRLCFSFFHFLQLGWGEAKEFCNVIGGELASFSEDQMEFLEVLHYMRDIGVTSDFWIGGRYVNDTKGWTWLTENAMEMGSPFWAVRYFDSCEHRQDGAKFISYWTNKTSCYHYRQAPNPDTTAAMCAALTYKHYHGITDEDCMTKKSPLCKNRVNIPETTTEQIPQAV